MRHKTTVTPSELCYNINSMSTHFELYSNISYYSVYHLFCHFQHFFLSNKKKCKQNQLRSCYIGISFDLNCGSVMLVEVSL